MKTLPFAITALSLLALTGCSVFDDLFGRENDHSTKVLMIGNSFSVSVMKDLPKIAQDRALDLDITSLYIGGCTFKRHMDNVKHDWDEEFKPYSMTRNFRGKVQPTEKVNLPEVLKGEIAYDIITIQQGSHESWDPATYAPGDEFVALIRKHQPQAKIYVQETWSYTPFDSRLKKWSFDQNEMYDRLHEAYRQFAARNGLEIIPMGTAVQRWRQKLPVRYTDHSFGGDVVGGRYLKQADMFKRDINNKWVLNSDPFHLNERGEYFQSLLWVVKLFDNVEIMDCEYVREKIDMHEALLMKEIVNEFK